MRNTHLVDDEVELELDLDDVDLMTLEDLQPGSLLPPKAPLSLNQELPPEEFAGWG